MNALPHFARIVPELSLDRAFDYSIPASLRSKVKVGSKVKVPFRNRTLVGFVLELRETAEVEKTKPILEVIGEEPYLPASLLEMAHWMKHYYCASLGSVMMTLMPKSVRHADAKFKERLWIAKVEGIPAETVAKEIHRSSKQKEAWDFLLMKTEGWVSDLSKESGISLAVWRALEDRGFVSIHAKTEERLPWMEMPLQPFLPLTLHEEQQVALDLILKEMKDPQPKPILMHGITGSGKTEVYLQAIHEVIRVGKRAIVLVPEISLTPQTIERFHGRFLGEKIRIAVLHSHLSDGERHDQWHQIREGRAQIVIGARSAIFAPMPDLGLIVVDEEHESSYKQEESPHYHARDLAVLRGHLEKIPVVLGSATPSLESMLRVEEGKYRKVRLNRRAGVESLPTIHLVDLKKDFGKKGKKQSMLSETLVTAIQARLDRQEQSLLFLNRRGYSSSIQCPQCGVAQECSHC
ncbi:MAG: primosomal protein N', partial [Verrucomicrobiota bacterium]